MFADRSPAVFDPAVKTGPVPASLKKARSSDLAAASNKTFSDQLSRSPDEAFARDSA